MNKGGILITIFFLCFAFVYGQSFNIDNGISLNEENKTYSVAYTVENNVDLKSPFDRGIVTRWSNDRNNSTKLGRFVEIEYDIGFEFEGTFKSQGKMKMIFANLETINVDENSKIGKGTSIGLTQKGAGNDFRIFVLTDTDDVKFLTLWTNNRKFKINNVWYWDPSFLFK